MICCTNKNPFEPILRQFLQKNLGEAEDQRFQLLEHKRANLKQKFFPKSWNQIFEKQRGWL